MRRDIKFRAWDAIEKKMWVPSINDSGQLMALGPTGVYITYDNPQDPLMQYTGLKDTNGVDIYEDDIFQYTNGLGETLTEMFYVKFKDGCFVCQNGITISNYLIEKDSVNIIGNIYENEELLK